MNRPLFGFALALGLGFATLSQAQDTKKAEGFADEAAKKLDLKSPNITDRKDFVLVTTLPEVRAKALADVLQTISATATSKLKLEKPEKEEPKPVVFVLPDLDVYGSFVRKFQERRPEKDELGSTHIDKDKPHVVVAPPVGEKNPNWEVMAGAELAKFWLEKKASKITLPEWMKDGYGTAVLMRSKVKGMDMERTKQKKLLLPAPPAKAAKSDVRIDWAWKEPGKPTGDAAGAAFMEYLVFGPKEEMFEKLIGGLRPSEETPRPTFTGVIQSFEWKVEDLDRDVRVWLATGK